MFMCLKFTFYYPINFSAHILDFISRTLNMKNEEFEVPDLFAPMSMIYKMYFGQASKF